MNDRIIPLSAESSELVDKNTRDQYDLRLRFAEAVSKKKGISLVEAIQNFTDLHIRLIGRWPGVSEEGDQLWQEFIRGVSSELGHEAILERIVQYAQRQKYERPRDPNNNFDPFSYGYSEKDRTIDLHFGSIRPEAGDPTAPGILSSARLPEMRQKLKEMFVKIRREHPDAETVRGASWLYNREAYRRLYPAVYTAHPQIRRGKFTGGGTWGQFRDKTGSVNDVVRQQFLRNLENLDIENLEDVFPNKTLMVSAPIAEFYKEYGVE